MGSPPCVQSIIVMAMSAAELWRMQVRMVPNNKNNRMVPKLLGSKLAKNPLRLLSSAGGIWLSPSVVNARNMNATPNKKSPI